MKQNTLFILVKKIILVPGDRTKKHIDTVGDNQPSIRVFNLCSTKDPETADLITLMITRKTIPNKEGKLISVWNVVQLIPGDPRGYNSVQSDITFPFQVKESGRPSKFWAGAFNSGDPQHPQNQMKDELYIGIHNVEDDPTFKN